MFGRRCPRSRRWITGFLLAVLLVVTGCSSNNGENIDGTHFEDDEADLPRIGGDPSEASVLLIGTAAPISALDPLGGGATHFGRSGLAGDLLYNVTDRLVEAGPRPDEFRPGLATEWTTSPDRRVNIFSLRKGVTFHDGSAFDADDVVWSLQRMLDHDQRSGQRAGPEPVAVVEATGEHEVTITVTDADADLLSRLSKPEASILPADLDGEVIGTGPYEVAELHPREFLTLRHFEGYWGDAPAVGTIRVTVYDSSVHLRDALVNDEVDVVFDALYPSQVSAAEDAGVNVARHAGIEAYFHSRITGVDVVLLTGRPIWLPLLSLAAGT